MRNQDSRAIRNVALVGHGHSGKTSLVSALLFTAGAQPRLGRVDDGSTVTDYDPEEIERKISLQIALAHLEWNRVRVNLLDTPGDGNFIHEARAALSAADAALVLVEGVSGVEVQTDKVWRFCADLRLPRMIVVSRMDRDNASAERAIASATTRLGKTVVPIQLPLGEGKDFRGVVDLLEMKAWTYERDASGKARPGDIPAELREYADAARKRLVEMVAELDDDMMARYLEHDTLEPGELLPALVQGIAACRLTPLVFSAGTANRGTTQLLDAVVALLPSPDTRMVRTIDVKDGSERSRPGTSDQPFAAQVFKTLADVHTGKLSLLRVWTGHMAGGDSLFNASRSVAERFHGFLSVQGKSTQPQAEVAAGDIVAVSKLKETTTNDTLCDKAHPVTLPPIDFPEPAMAFAIEPKTRGDEDKLNAALHRVLEEDPTIRSTRDPQTHEMLLSGMGDGHVEVVVARLRKRFGVDVLLHLPKVPYRETIKRKVEVQGKHKKQTGGHGQFADCWVRFEPLPRGGGFEYSDEVFGGSVPHNFRPAVEKGIIDAATRGSLAGYPMVDFRATLFDGSYHSVDSSEMAFKIAGALAFRKGMEQAQPVLLEPVMKVAVQAPDENMGDVIGQLNTRRGRIQGMADGVVNALVPMAEMLTFAPILKSLTSGRGSSHMEFSHYDEVPAQAAQKIVEAAKKPAHSDEDE